MQVPKEEFHLTLELTPEGTYRIAEWERGRWQREGAGAFERNGSQLKLLQVEPGMDMVLYAHAAPEGFLVCTSASEERERGSGTLVGEHVMVEQTVGAQVVNDGMTMQVKLGEDGSAAVTTLDGQVTLQGSYSTTDAWLELKGSDGRAVTLLHWFSDGKLVLCRDAFRAATRPAG